MKDETAELPLNLPPPEITPEQVGQLIALLRTGHDDEAVRLKRKGWMTAAEIAARMEDGTDRLVRKIAAAAGEAVVSYPGSPGYKLWELCSVEEINHAIEAFESQARDMIKRAAMFRRAYHRRFRGASL